jgi:hypothetical protein
MEKGYGFTRKIQLPASVFKQHQSRLLATVYEYLDDFIDKDHSNQGVGCISNPNG